MNKSVILCSSQGQDVGRGGLGIPYICL